MLGWLGRDKKKPGWLAASVDAGGLDFAHARSKGAGQKMAVTAYGTRPLPKDSKNALQKAAHDMHFNQYQCTTLLRPGDYQLLLVEAPTVPKEELKAAIRWRIKDMIDYHVDDATLDALDIPVDEGATNSRARMMYAVCARNEVIQGCTRAFQDADIPLSVIDIRETAQRNVAALYEEPGRGIALAYFADDWGLLTITFRTELVFARRLELGVKQLSAANAATRKDALDRVALELQRTFDHFDRQFHYVAIAKLLVAPQPGQGELAEFLRASVTPPVETVDLRDKLAFEDTPPDPDVQWRLFHHFGAALRSESKAL